MFKCFKRLRQMDIRNVTMYENNDIIMYTSLPQMRQLRCTVCGIDVNEVRDTSAKSNFHWRTMKCRLLIYLIPDVIAAPDSVTQTKIFVLTSEAYLKTNRLAKIFREMHLVYQGSQLVTPEVYKACLTYTIECKLAPSWNKIGKYLLQGKEFYNATDGTEAITLDVVVGEKDVSLHIMATRIKVPYMKIEDLCLSEENIDEFLADPKGYLDLSALNNAHVHVLPSLKRGKVVYVTKVLPDTCPLKNYEQLRRHWKNMYGFSLPKSDNGILYYGIKFPVPNFNVCTYPDLCVSSGPLEFIRNTRNEFTIPQFASDIVEALPTVCGKVLHVSKYNTFNNRPLPTNMLPTSHSLSLSPQKMCMGDESQSNFNSTLQMDFSAKHTDGLLVDRKRKISTSALNVTLAKIQKIHNTAVLGSTNSDSINTGASTSKICTQEDSGIKKQKESSKYFETQDSCSNTEKDKSQSIEGENKENLSLREKLLNARNGRNKETLLHKTIQDIDVETIARNNKLHELNKNVLSAWLKKRFIPHNTKATKMELINKVLSEIKNTEILRTFRM